MFYLISFYILILPNNEMIFFIFPLSTIMK